MAATQRLPGPDHRPPENLTMQVSAGFNAYFQTNPAWVPVRVTLHNGGHALIDGNVEIPDTTIANPTDAPLSLSAVYGAPVVLPAGATKQVTVYLPGTDIQGSVKVLFRRYSEGTGQAGLQKGRILASVSTFPSDLQYSDVLIGTLTSDLTSTSWLQRVAIPRASIKVVPLSPANLDSVPQVLASFDLIVVTNDSSRLDAEQTYALERYVRNGGSLLLIGGPSWQESLSPLPATLLPGSLSGSRTVKSLSGLASLGAGQPVGYPAGSARLGDTGTPAPQPTIISVLTHPQGAVLASQGKDPLVVRRSLGDGQIEYLAFDPELDPIDHWSGASPLLARLVAGAAPLVIRRISLPSSYRSPSFLDPGQGPLDIASELSNIPAAALPSFVLIICLTAFYVLLVGPVNFLVLRRLKRVDLAWVTIPLLALLCIGSSFGLALRLKGNTVLLNTVSMVTLDGSSDRYPATMYVGLFAPLRGDYYLTLDAPALPVPILAQSDGDTPVGDPPPGWRFEEGDPEGAPTEIDLPSMNMWSMRAVALHTDLSIPGDLRASLSLDRSGVIVGSIVNNTGLRLIRPAIIAGRAVQRLPDIAPGASVRIRVLPSADVQLSGGLQPVFGLYGRAAPPPGSSASDYTCIPVPNSACTVPVPSGGSGAPAESTLSDRMRNALSMLPETRLLPMLGEVSLVGWTEQPLGSLSVDGVTPQRRDLTLIVKPLSVSLPSGTPPAEPAWVTFRLRTGTIGAQLVAASPAQPLNACCGPTVQPVYIGVGGTATFEFDLQSESGLPASETAWPGSPRGAPASHSLHFRRLNLWVHPSSPDGDSSNGNPDRVGLQVYDWRSTRWVGAALRGEEATLPDPDRFVSSTGALMLRLAATRRSGEIAIFEPHLDLQVEGTGVVR